MSSLLKVSPGIKPRFFNQNIAQKLPEKNIPSTAANAISLSEKLLVELIHFKAQSALHFTEGMFYIAANKKFFSSLSWANSVSIRVLYVSL
jgi:hypothetical protein